MKANTESLSPPSSLFPPPGPAKAASFDPPIHTAAAPTVEKSSPSLLSRAASTALSLAGSGAKLAGKGALRLGAFGAKAAFNAAARAVGRVSTDEPVATAPANSSEASSTTSAPTPTTVMTAAPSAALPSLAMSAKPSRYIHESFFFCPHTKKIHRLTLEVPVQVSHSTPLDEIKQLNTALDTYKDHFVKHLIEQKESPEIFKTDFDIHFSEGGYTLAPKASNSATIAITSDEAQRYSNLIRVTDRNAMSASLSNPTSYAPLPTTAITPPAATTATTVPPTTTSSEVAPPPIAHDTNSCYAAATLWYLHNDPQITLDVISKTLTSSKAPEEQAVLTQLQKQLSAMRQGQSISKEEINAFRAALVSWKPDAIAKTSTESGDASQTIYLLSKLILKDNYSSFAQTSSETVEKAIQRSFAETTGNLPKTFDMDLTPRATLDAPATIEVLGSSYKLTKALCHPNSDHFTTLIRKADGNYYDCDDLTNTSKIIKESDLKAYKNVVKLRYVLDDVSQATSTQPAAATKAEKSTAAPAIKPPRLVKKGAESLITAIHFLGSNPLFRKQMLQNANLNRDLTTLLKAYDEQIGSENLIQALDNLQSTLKFSSKTTPEQAINAIITLIPENDPILMSRGKIIQSKTGFWNWLIGNQGNKLPTVTQFPVIDVPGGITSLSSYFQKSLRQYHSSAGMYTQHEYYQAPNLLSLARKTTTSIEAPMSLTLAQNSLIDTEAHYSLSSFRTKDATYVSFNKDFWEIRTDGRQQKIDQKQFEKQAAVASDWTYIKEGKETKLDLPISLHKSGATLDTLSTTKAEKIPDDEETNRWVVTSSYRDLTINTFKELLAQEISTGDTGRAFTLIGDEKAVKEIRKYANDLLEIQKKGIVTIGNLTFEIVKTPSELTSNKGAKLFSDESISELIEDSNGSLNINLRSAPLTDAQKREDVIYQDDATESSEQATLDALLVAKPTHPMHLFISEEILIRNYENIQKRLQPQPPLRSWWWSQTPPASPKEAIKVSIGGTSMLATAQPNPSTVQVKGFKTPSTRPTPWANKI